MRRSHSEFIEKLKSINPSVEVIGEYTKAQERKNAVILAHYYEPAEAQEVADCVGDSLYLAKIAKKEYGGHHCFCGVSFMGLHRSRRRISSSTADAVRSTRRSPLSS